MICTWCRQGKFWKCIDLDKEKTRTTGRGKNKRLVTPVLRSDRLYRSCACQWKGEVVPHDAPTADPTDC